MAQASMRPTLYYADQTTEGSLIYGYCFWNFRAEIQIGRMAR